MATLGRRGTGILPAARFWAAVGGVWLSIASADPGRAASGDAAPAASVDLLLVLAVDISASISREEQRLQRSGYVEAFRAPEVIAAIGSGRHGRIAVAYVEWAGPAVQSLAVPWTLVDGRESAERLAEIVGSLPLRREFDTSLAGALSFSAAALAASPYRSERRIIDVSGNGPNNTGPPVLPAREAVLAAGITINGLPVMTKVSWSGGLYSIEGLDYYFEDCVIGGPDAFVIAVKHREEFKQAIARKLIREIAGRDTPILPAALAARPRHMDCLAGEHNSGRLLPRN